MNEAKGNIWDSYKGNKNYLNFSETKDMLDKNHELNQYLQLRSAQCKHKEYQVLI